MGLSCLTGANVSEVAGRGHSWHLSLNTGAAMSARPQIHFVNPSLIPTLSSSLTQNSPERISYILPPRLSSSCKLFLTARMPAGGWGGGGEQGVFLCPVHWNSKKHWWWWPLGRHPIHPGGSFTHKATASHSLGIPYNRYHLVCAMLRRGLGKAALRYSTCWGKKAGFLKKEGCDLRGLEIELTYNGDKLFVDYRVLMADACVLYE